MNSVGDYLIWFLLTEDDLVTRDVLLLWSHLVKQHCLQLNCKVAWYGLSFNNLTVKIESNTWMKLTTEL